MGKDFRLKLEKVFDFLGEILAFLVILIWVAEVIDTKVGFLPTEWRGIVVYSRQWGTVLLLAVEGFECTIKRNIIIRLLFYALLAVLIVFLFMPEQYDWLMSYVPSVKK